MAHSITLQTGEATVVDGDVLGRLGFAASAETDGSEAIKTVAKIEAVAEEEFTASQNQTEMVFYLASDGDAASKMTLSSAGLLTPAGGITSTGAANTLGATSFNDANITNVGNIALDSISADASALSIDSNWDAAGVTCSDLGAVTTADINGGTIDGTNVTVGSSKTLDVSAGTLTTSAAQNLAIAQGAASNIDIGEYDLRAATVTADGLASGRVVFAGTNGVLSSDADLTFSTDTLTATKLKVSDGGTIGSASDPDAITIASAGKVTFSQAVVGAVVVGGTSGTIALDCTASNYFTIAAGGDIDGLNFTGAVAGQRIIVRIVNGGSHTIAFGTDTIKWPGGTAPVLSSGSGKIDVYGFLCTTGSTAFDGFIIGQDLATP